MPVGAATDGWNLCPTIRVGRVLESLSPLSPRARPLIDFGGGKSLHFSPARHDSAIPSAKKPLVAKLFRHQT